jgi:hypothetical protein
MKIGHIRIESMFDFKMFLEKMKSNCELGVYFYDDSIPSHNIVSKGEYFYHDNGELEYVTDLEERFRMFFDIRLGEDEYAFPFYVYYVYVLFDTPQEKEYRCIFDIHTPVIGTVQS